MKYDLEKVIVVEYDDKLQADLEKVLTRMGGPKQVNVDQEVVKTKKALDELKPKTFSDLELNRLKNQPKAKPAAPTTTRYDQKDVIERAHGYRFRDEFDNGDRIYYDPVHKRQIYVESQDLARSFQIAKEKLGLAAKYRQEAEMRHYDKQRRINQQVKLKSNKDLIRKTYS